MKVQPKMMFLFLIFTLLCRAHVNVLDTFFQIMEDELENDSLTISNRAEEVKEIGDETEVGAYKRNRRRRIYKPANGGGAIAPDPLNSISYSNIGKGECTHNGAAISHMKSANGLRDTSSNNGYDEKDLCELACSYKDKCTGYTYGEEKAPAIVSMVMGKRLYVWHGFCNLYGDWTDSDISSQHHKHWEFGGFVLHKAGSGVVTSGGGVGKTELQNTYCYQKKVSNAPMPSTVSSCPRNKELVKYSNGGSACESPPDWKTASCNKLRPSLNGFKVNGYGCRGCVWNNRDKEGATAGDYCKEKPWYSRCCTYDSDYNTCYPKVFDCHIWPKRLYANKLANYYWYEGPCQYAITSSGAFSKQRCKGGDSYHLPSNEGNYMYFKQCCQDDTGKVFGMSPRCYPKGNKVHPRIQGKTYYWN